MADSTTRSFSDLPRIMRQRWYFTIIGLLVTIALCGLASMAVPVKYQAKAQILVLPPKTSVGTGGNPYLALGGLQAAADVLARAMSDGDTFRQLQEAGITGNYTVARDLTTSGPVLLVDADNSSPALALQTLRAILAQAAPRLTQLQDSLSVPLNTRLTTNIFTQDSTAAPQRKSQIRAILVALAAGIFATVLLVSAGDSLLLRRSRRRLARKNAAVGAAGDEPPVAPHSRAAPRPADRPSAKSAKRAVGNRPQGGTRNGDTDELQTILAGEPEPEPAPRGADSTEWSAVTTEHAGRRGHG